VTVNYLLDSLYAPPPQEPAGVIDLGGGSVQIVYPTPADSSAPAGYTQDLDFGTRKHHVYIKSHLGFGLDAARNAALDLLTSRHEAGKAIRHPCLPSGATMTHKGYTLEGDGDWHRCKKLQQRLFDHSGCAHTSCSFGGAYQPALPKTFYGFSYLYDRVTAIGLLDGKLAQFGSQETTLADIERAGVTLCALDQAHTAARFREHQDASKSNNFCGDVAYLSALLASLGFQDDFRMTMTNKIKDVELVWTLGAMLAKSAELANEGGGGPAGFRGGLLVIAAAVAVWVFSKRYSRSGYRHVSNPLTGHESD